MTPSNNKGHVLVGHHSTNHPRATKITIGDNAGEGNDNHRYDITGIVAGRNPSALPWDDSRGVTILFQNGPLVDGVENGIFMEDLLAICHHRLACLQAGPYACGENAKAMDHVASALFALQTRTGRIAEEDKKA